MSFNAYPSSRKSAFTASGFNARGHYSNIVVSGARTNTWEGNDGQLKSVWFLGSDIGIPTVAYDFGATAYVIKRDNTDNLVIGGGRNTIWDNDTSNTAGAGTNANIIKLDNSQTLVATLDHHAISTIFNLGLDPNGNVYTDGIGTHVPEKLASDLASTLWTGLEENGWAYMTNGAFVYVNTREYLYKLNASTGATVWDWKFDAGTNSLDLGIATNGYIMVRTGYELGTTWDKNASGDLGDGTAKTVFSFTSAGTLTWAWYGGTRLNDITVTPNGSIYCCGARNTNWKSNASDDDGAGTSKTLWKLNSSGTVQWAWNHGRPGNNSFAIAANDEKVVVGGVRTDLWDQDAAGTAGPGTNATVWQLDPDGVVTSTFDSDNSIYSVLV